MDDPTLRASLAYYRATAGLSESLHRADCPLYKPPELMRIEKKEKQDAKENKSERDELDPLDPENHQQLNLLLYSYSTKSANIPDFCVNPWTVSMEMYGRRDITLGAFLDKYCFNGDAKCPSSNCQVPMNQHVRKFVHEDVCVTITWNSVEHSNRDITDDDKARRVMYWSVCSICSSESPRSILSYSSLRLALSVVLSLTQRRSLYEVKCRHSLYHQNHYYARGGITNESAAFRFSKITPWDIIFPPHMITTKYDTKIMRDSLLQQVNDLILRGHETFASLTESDAEKDHSNFKQHMDQIHLALTSETLQEQTTSAGVVRSLWSIYDRVIIGEKMRRDAQDKCSQNKSNKAQQETVVEEKQETESMSSVDSNLDLESIVNKDEIDKSGEDDEDKENKKTVRQLLLQLLSNNQTSNQNGIIITSGLIPVVVSASEVGSVIAATLATAVCKAFYTNQSVNEDSESNSNTTKEKSESDKSKTKSNEHIEVQLKEGLICRVYFAQQFHKLRHMLLSPLDSNPRINDEYAKNNIKVETSTKDKCDTKGLCDIEEGFIRSLAHCVPWAAKGGKSGSTFCKTKDDRYVLKEMTKPEWLQFLEFAPHYFNYVYTCRQSNLPSLLARIVGVFGVGGLGGTASGVLVLEHLFYERDVRPRFDLKGSQRNRLAQDQPHSVLMDENLLNLRWKSPFYLQSHTASVLLSAIERDASFLSEHFVMDYSLLLGVYQDKLVLGIIDYIRTFTWDKKLEHIVKKNLGPGQPTVVSPQQYKARFIEAMKKYFLHCVAHWDHLQLPLCDT